MRRLVGIHAVSAALRSARASGRRLDRVLVAQGRAEHQTASAHRRVPAHRDPGSGSSPGPSCRGWRERGHTRMWWASRQRQDTGPWTRSCHTRKSRARSWSWTLIQDPHNLGAIIRTSEAAGATADRDSRETVGRAERGDHQGRCRRPGVAARGPCEEPWPGPRQPEGGGLLAVRPRRGRRRRLRRHRIRGPLLSRDGKREPGPAGQGLGAMRLPCADSAVGKGRVPQRLGRRRDRALRGEPAAAGEGCATRTECAPREGIRNFL